MKIKSLNDLFVEQLQDMYYAENKLARMLPKMAEKATDPNLTRAFEKHLAETEDQVLKLADIMASLDLKVEGKKCEAIEGLLKEANSLIGAASSDNEALDAALILAAQKIEHYEIATYGCLCAFANRLGRKQQAQTLHSILDQERNADEVLTKLAEHSPGINERAKAA